MSELMIGGHLVARALRNEGIRTVYTLCGGHVAPIYDGCLRQDIAILDTRHEQAAVHAADAHARLTRGCGVAILTAGPGVTDGVTGVANAFQAQVPFDFESCIRHKLPVVCIVGNDAGWGQIRGPQKMVFGEDRAPATKLLPTRYDKIVEAMGGRGEHIEDPGQLAPALRRAFESNETTCIDVKIDPDFMVRSGQSKLSV